MPNWWEDPAFIGGAIGTVVMPGIGTGVGAAIGQALKPGQRRTPSPVQVNPNAAQMPSYDEDRRRNLAAALAAQGRGGPQMGMTQLDPSQQAQFRQGQMSLAQMLAAQANGQGPSLAQAQLRAATDRNMAQAQALAQANAGGQNAGLVQRNIFQQQQGAAQQAAQDSGALRIQEQTQAQQQLAALLAGARGQDIGLAAENAQLSQGANQQNLAALLAQRGMNDQMTMGYERNVLGLGAQQGGQNMDLARLLAQTGLGNEQLAQSAWETEEQRRQRRNELALMLARDGAGALGSAMATGVAM